MSYRRYKDKAHRKEYNRKYQRKYMAKWRRDNPSRAREIWRNDQLNERQRVRQKVFDYLGGAVCVNCGCTEREILEINHKKLGGRKELSGSQYMTYLRDIIKLKRKKEFEVRCKVCNAVHYVEKKYGIKYTVHCHGRVAQLG